MENCIYGIQVDINCITAFVWILHHLPHSCRMREAAITKASTVCLKLLVKIYPLTISLLTPASSILLGRKSNN